ncbi:MAG: [FeFe] hydrogenase H-cluster radical SAM maturase HydE [Patescibacteria group bacterium]|nr:[FeFe] hydrogenase H-cluster radical SAM maturase HydE [Patescibacteria group bacterium]
MKRETVLRWLRETDPGRLAQLWAQADEARRSHVGDCVHLRGLLEISNFCSRQCAYCGIASLNHHLERYRMTEEEILECAALAEQFGYGTIVLQAGEDAGLAGPAMSELLRKIKARHNLAVTLSLGERSDQETLQWRQVGADRYLLRFETSNAQLYRGIHPPGPDGECDRIAMLRRLRDMGYEIGSGVMIGIPGQTYDDLADDILLFAELDLDMIGVGPYIQHPSTSLARLALDNAMPTDRRVPNTELMTYKVVALSRLTCPEANIPSTTALATLNSRQGRELGLVRGANVLMPNLTPPRYRRLYEIYPDKACIRETAQECHGCIRRRIASIGRRVGSGPGTRLRASYCDQPY